MSIQLVLFDIDGTLVLGRDPLNALAIDAALVEVMGLPPGATPDDVSHHGCTESWVYLALARHYGIPDATAQTRLAATFSWKDRRLALLVADARDAARLPVAPGAASLLDRLLDLRIPVGLVSGNTEWAGRSKLTRAGLDERRFSISAWGDAHEDRSEMVGAAVREALRALPGLRRGEILVVGDTPEDVRAGRANGTMTLAVATGRYTHGQLGATPADLVVDTLWPSEAIERLLRDPLDAAA